MNNLLINEPPLQVLPSLAVAIGYNEATVLQQIHYLCNQKLNFRDGKYWVYNTYDEWHSHFPFWSVSTVKRVFNSLKVKGLVHTGNFNKTPCDKTIWYSVNYNTLRSLILQVRQNDPIEGAKMKRSNGSKRDVGTCQNDQTNTKDYTKNNTKNINNNGESVKARRSKSQELEKNFEQLWELYPRKEAKAKAFIAYKKAIKDGVTNKEIQDGIVGYKHKLQRERTEQKYIAQGGTWFHNRRWEDDYGVVVVSHKQVAPPPKEQEEELSEEEARMLLEGLTEGVNENANNVASDEST